jgi:hypothetical protein
MNLSFVHVRRSATSAVTLFFVLVALGLAYLGLGGLLTVILLLIVCLFALWAYLVYFCEDYVFYASCIHGLTIVSLVFLASSLPASAMFQGGTEERVVRAVLALMPLIIISRLLGYVKNMKLESCAFRISGDKVEITDARGPDSGMKISCFLVLGLVVAAGGFLIKHAKGVTIEALIVFLLTLGSFLFVWACRAALHGLYWLAKTKRHRDIPLRFFLVEEIREARQKTYVVRLFKWLCSKTKRA